MSLLDRLADLAKSAATIDLQLQQLRGDLDKLTQRVDEIDRAVQAHDSRLTRLEASREADRAQLEGERRSVEATLAQFRAEVERLELRLSRGLPPTPDTP